MLNLGLIIIYVFLTAGIFVTDINLPLGVAAGVPYILPILVTLWSKNKYDTYLVAVTGGILTVVGYFLSPVEGGVAWMVIANRLIALFTITVAALFVTHRKASEKKIKLLNEKLETLSCTDPLTQTGNRLHFNNTMTHELARAVRYKLSLSLLMFDIDHFKKINDKYGHDIGDKVLVNIVTLVNNTIRKTDSLFRIGGEEFMIILTDTSLENAQKAAVNLCKTVFHHNNDVMNGVTISIGVTEMTKNDSMESILKKADMAMYEAKNSGRNRVCCFTVET